MEEAYADMLLHTLDDSVYKFPFMEKDEALRVKQLTYNFLTFYTIITPFKLKSIAWEI